MPTRRSRLRPLAPWILFWIGLTLFFATQAGWMSVLTDRQAPPFWRVLLAHGAHWPLWGLLSLVVVTLARRFPLEPGVRLRHAAIHLAAALGIGSLQLVVMQSIVHAVRVAAGESPSYAGELRREFGDFFHLNLLTYGLILVVAAALDSQRRAREQELLAARLAEQLTAARLAALQMQIHPHFLFNSLHSAAELVHEDPALAERTLLRLAELLRRSLRESQREEVPLAECLEFVDDYLALEGVRLEGKLRVDYRVPEELLAARVPSLLLQPLVENAVRHGVARRREGGAITVAARARGGALELEVTNDRPSSDAPPVHAGAGIGLANVRARLEQRYGRAASLDAGEEGERFVARLRLPLDLGPEAPPAGAPARIALEGTS